MSPRFLTRLLVASALAAALLGTGATAAHAAHVDATADASYACQYGPNGDGWAVWTINLHADPQAQQPVAIAITRDNLPVEHDTLAPGQQTTLERSGFDGLASHLRVEADGTTVFDATKTLACNKPEADITFQCNFGGPSGHDAALWLHFQNYTDVPATFVLHFSNGKAYTYTSKGDFGFSDILNEDVPYKAYITINGAVAATKSGFTNCVKDKTVSTTTTTTVASHTTTPTTVASGGVPDPVAPTTVKATTVRATTVKAATVAATGKTLPMTGSTSAPLGLAGLALVSGGSLALLLARRRARSV